MKLKNIKFMKFSLLAALCVFLVTTACGPEDPDPVPPGVELTDLIAEAEDLIANSVEGTSPGLYQPGSIQKLQDILTWVDWQIENATKQKEIDDATIRLYNSIEAFKLSTVQLAVPLLNNTAGSWIQISDNIKDLLVDSDFTIEIEAYYLGPGWIETIFSAGEGDDGGPFGFNLRSFGDRFDLVVGAGPDGWKETYVTGGAGLKLGEWVHYALTKSGSEWKVYMDGVEIISESEFPATNIFRADVPFVLGETPFWYDLYEQNRAYNGMLKDFRVWSTVRTADELIANKDEMLTGTEEGLEVYFPMDADLGSEFTDNTGNYTATIVGSGIVWAVGGVPPVIELDYTGIDQAIADATALKETIVEGTNDGDYPVGTLDYLQAKIDEATATKEAAEKQDELDAAAASLLAILDAVEDMIVADAFGVYVDRDDASAVGLRITPNYTPTGDYTIEFDLKLKTLEMGGSGEIFGNGTYGLRVYGYTNPTPEEILASGGLWNFTDIGGWGGPSTSPAAVRPGAWQHVAIVHDDAAQTTAIFVDGEQKAIATETPAPIVSGWGEIWLGNSWGSKMNGTIKDFRIWDEVRAELNAEIDGSEANLQVYFPLDKVAGFSFSDVTGDYNGELVGIEWNLVE